MSCAATQSSDVLWSPPSADQAGAGCSASRLELSGDAHIGQSCAIVSVHQDVLRLDVAMDDYRLSPQSGLRLVEILRNASTQDTATGSPSADAHDDTLRLSRHGSKCSWWRHRALMPEHVSITLPHRRAAGVPIGNLIVEGASTCNPLVTARATESLATQPSSALLVASRKCHSRLRPTKGYTSMGTGARHTPNRGTRFSCRQTVRTCRAWLLLWDKRRRTDASEASGRVQRSLSHSRRVRWFAVAATWTSLMSASTGGGTKLSNWSLDARSRT